MDGKVLIQWDDSKHRYESGLVSLIAGKTVTAEFAVTARSDNRIRVHIGVTDLKPRARQANPADIELGKPGEALGGEEVVDGIIEAYAFAEADPFRCSTHNKGIMNGIDAVILATGNDFRAIEAGAHAYAAWKHGGYKPLTSYEKNENGDLVGKIEIPMAVGLIGGATAVHPTAKIAVKILNIKSASDLAQIVAAVGLAQNFAAMRALATEGIQRGHMGLHARNIAVMAGADGEMIDKVVAILVKEKNVRIDRAKEVLEELS